MRDRLSLKSEIALAVMPAVTVVGVLLLLKTFSKQQILFSSLASSAFLIYVDPKHPANSIRTLLIAQLSAAIIGYLVYLVAGPGYVAASVSMVIAITVMILAHAMHPPAVSTALLFAFQTAKLNVLVLFGLAVILLILLVVIQRASLWMIKRYETRK
jgi:CBS-domain-containing membrane protein